MSWFLQRFWRHSNELARLATPTIISRTGILMLAVVDTRMLGPLGAEEVGRYGLGTSLFVLLLVSGIGLQFGTVVLTSHHRGAGRLAETGAVWRRSIPYAILLGVLFTLAAVFAEEYFRLVGQRPELAARAASVTLWQGLGLLPMFLYINAAFFLEGLGRPIPVMIVIWVANGLNILLNLWLIHGVGGGGVPGDLAVSGVGISGADGASLATTLVRIGMAAALIGYIWYLKDRHELGVRRKPRPGWFAGGGEQRKYGYASGLSYAFESGAFHVMSIFAGWLPAAELASFALNINLLAMIFMTALGIATATAVRVGVAHGRRDWPDRTLAGWTGLFWTAVAMGVLSTPLVVAPEWVVGEIYEISDTAVLAAAAPATVLVGFLMLADGGQIVMSNSLRAAADPWAPTVMNFLSYLVIMIPAAWYLAIHLDRRAEGLFEAILAASIVSLTILSTRWVWISIKRHRQTKAAIAAQEGE